MNPATAALLEQYALSAYARGQANQGELEAAQRIAGNAHAGFMLGASYGGYRSITQGDDPEAGMAYNFAHGIPGSNLGPGPSGKV